jgi:hypothetical protein
LYTPYVPWLRFVFFYDIMPTYQKKKSKLMKIALLDAFNFLLEAYVLAVKY